MTKKLEKSKTVLFSQGTDLTAGVCTKSATCWLYAFRIRKKAACYFTCFTPCQCTGANQFLLTKRTAIKCMTGGSNSPGQSVWLTAQTAKCYVCAWDMISQLEKRGRAAQDVLTQNLRTPLNSHILILQIAFLILASAFWETKFYPSHQKNKKIFQNKIKRLFSLQYSFIIEEQENTSKTELSNKYPYNGTI